MRVGGEMPSIPGMVSRIPRWLIRVAVGVVVVVGLVWGVTGWLHSNAIRSEFLTARSASTDYSLAVQSNTQGRVVMDRSPESEKSGFWGLESSDAYAQVSTIVRVDQTTVERRIAPLIDTVSDGSLTRIDVDAYAGDPTVAHGLGFQDLRTPSDIGPHPAWLVDGRRPTWIVFVHGRGNDRLDESLRIIPSLVEQGFPILSLTYRNDIGATPNESGLRLWGLEEWRDLDAALSLAQRNGAKDFVIIGSGYGASIVSTFLHESLNIALIRGVIYDSPILDLEGVVKRWSDGTPRPVSWLGRRLSTLRFGLDWGGLNQLERTDQFDIRMLMMFGAQDPETPVEVFKTFAEALPDLVDTARFEQGGHTDLWNIDSERYESAVARFLLDVVGEE